MMVKPIPLRSAPPVVYAGRLACSMSGMPTPLSLMTMSSTLSFRIRQRRVIFPSFSGKTIEILNSDAEGRLILADGLAWAAEREGCTHLVDIATLTGAVCAMLGFVTTGVMASDNGFYDCLLCAAERSGEKFWRMPDDAEYETLIESDYADVRNTSKDGCGAITAGLFLKKFTAGRPWLHLDIAGTADNTGIVWQHQVPGATGTAVSTLYHLAQILFETSEEEPA